MANCSVAAELVREEQQRGNTAQKELEHRKWLKDFALVLAVILLTITAATVLAGLGAPAK